MRLNLENMPHERSQYQKATYYMIPFMKFLENGHICRNRIKQCLPGAWWGKE
jgi:hypothetical protein